MPDPDQSDSLLAFRLVAPKWVASALSGEGARLYGGRWNSPGRPMVYLSLTRSLAALELLAHLTTVGSRKLPRTLVTVRVPRELIGGKLWKSEGWREEPPGKSSTDQGDDWLAVAKSVGVLAPSAIIPEEHNLLLNPRHPEIRKVDLLKSQPFSFDPRLTPPLSSSS